MNRLLVFNPGHEEALIYSVEKRYTPPKSIRKMMKQLASLMLAFVEEGDYIFVPNEDYTGASVINHNGELVRALSILPKLSLYLWALEPHIINHISQWAIKVGLQLELPHISEQYLSMSHRRYSADLLRRLQQDFPYLFPHTYTIPRWLSVDDNQLDVEYIQTLCLEIAGYSPRSDIIIKRPFTSSGRGVYPLSTPVTAEQAQTIIQQIQMGGVSIEPRLDCYQDYALLFELTSEEVKVLGYSKFSTDVTRGTNYMGNILVSQESIRTELVWLLGNEPDNLRNIELSIAHYLREQLLGEYEGYVGVDMFAYTDELGNAWLHPCVEINLRTTMGVLAMKLYDKYVHTSQQAVYRLQFVGKVDIRVFHTDLESRYPLELDSSGKLLRGYRALTPIDGSEFIAYMIAGT